MKLLAQELPSVGLMETLIPIVAILIGGLIAVSAIMAGHQRKMAEMVRQNAQPDVSGELLSEIKSLRAEILVMRTEQHQTAIALDDLRKNTALETYETSAVEVRSAKETT